MKPQAQQLAMQSRSAQKAGDFVKAGALLKRALEVEPDDPSLQLENAQLLFNQQKFREAAHVLHTLHLKHPDHRGIWRDCGTVYIKLGEFKLAEQFLKKCVASDPNDYDSWKSLCFIAGSSMRHSDGIFYAMQAMQLRPLDPEAHNNLGSVLLGVGRYEDALVSFDTALKLRPGSLDALSNIGTTLSLQGDPAGALKIYQECLEKSKPDSGFAKALRYRMSFDYFRLGDLKNGWESYDYGFYPTDLRSRAPKRQFDIPQWDGRPLPDQTLLVWREQGLGDELMFLSVLGEVLQHCPNIIVECDQRLIAPLSRAFPTVQVRKQSMALPDLRSTHNDFDFHVPMGSLMKFYRPTLEDFGRAHGYLVPDPERRPLFAERVAALPNKVKIGICWRSGQLNPERNSSYVPISDLEPLLRLPNVDFINLQYGDCTEEMKNVEEHFGVVIHHWPDLDLRDDLDGVFTLMSCLDHVVTAKTAVSEMAPAVGVPTSIFMPPRAWTLFGQDRYVFYPEVDAFVPSYGESIHSVIPHIAEQIMQRYELA